MNVLETLRAADEALIDWILDATPETEEDRAAMREVLALRTKLDQAMNRLVGVELESAAEELADEVTALAVVTEDLKTVDRTIERVGDVLRWAGIVVDVAAKLVSWIG
jgi:hypothetical protein